MPSPKSERVPVNSAWLEIGKIFLELELERMREKAAAGQQPTQPKPASPMNKALDELAK